MLNSAAAVVPDPEVVPAPPSALKAAAAWTGRVIWNLPRSILILLLMAYRKVISPLYGQVCRFFPSCSAYALEAITVHGAVLGSWLAVRRLLRCHPWNAGGVDHVPAGDRQWPEDCTPTIVVLNNPDKYLAARSDGEGRNAA